MLRLDNSALLDFDKMSEIVVLTNNDNDISIYPTSKLLKIKPGFIVGYNFYSRDNGLNGIPVKSEDVLKFNKDQLSDDVKIYVFQGCATKPIELFPIITDEDDDASESQYIHRNPSIEYIGRGQTMPLAYEGDKYFTDHILLLKPNNAYEIRFSEDTDIFEQTIKAGEPLYAIYGKYLPLRKVLIFATIINGDPQGFVITPNMGCTIAKCARECDNNEIELDQGE